MKIEMEPTDQLERVEGTLCRVWTGSTDKGTPVEVWVRCVSPQTHDSVALEVFERQLKALPPARREAVAYDLRFLV